MKKLITSTSLVRAHLMEYSELMNNISTHLTKCDLEQLQLKEEANRFQETFIDFQKSIKQTKKTGITEQLKTVEHNCDRIILALQHFIKGFMLLPDKETMKMAREVSIRMKKHAKYIVPLSQLEKSGVIHIFLKDLSKPPMVEIIKQLGLVAIIQQLTENIQLFDKLYRERINKESDFIVGLTAKKRKQMQQAFEHLCATIEALAILGDKNDYQPLANFINTGVAEIKRLYLLRKTQ